MIRCCLFLLFSLVSTADPAFVFQQEIPYAIEVIHPGIDLVKPTDCVLFEVQDDQQQPVAFYMDVESVVCGNSLCRVDLVRVFWNEFGQFDRLELPPGVELEKDAGKDFTLADYVKLNTILADHKSPLKDVYKYEIVSTLGGEGVDGMTGATVLVDKTAYVEGAVWTCYSLWHWVNGPTKDIIRDITGSAYPTEGLLKLLRSFAQPRFAITALKNREDFSDAAVATLLQAIKVNASLLKPSLDYWEAAPNAIFLSALRELMEAANPELRLAGMRVLLHTQQPLPPGFIQELPLDYSTLAYPEVHVLLKIIDSKTEGGPQIIDNLLPLLESDNFLIARRAYWFLAEQALTEGQQGRVDGFFAAFKDRL